MNKKHAFVYSAIFLAVAVIITGFCFVFFGNKVIKEIPKTLTVQKYDDEFYLVTDYSGEFGYQFKLEQFIGNGYVTLGTVESQTNALNLSRQNLDIEAGQRYRFSVCFTTENGAGNSAYSEALIWTPVLTLMTVDYSTVNFDLEHETLTWRSVYLAEDYAVRFVDKNGTTVERTATTNSLNTSSVEAGDYKVFVIAKSTNSSMKDSYAGVGIDVSIVRKNVIVNVERNNRNALTIKTTQKVNAFEIYQNGELKGTLNVTAFETVSGNYVYRFDNAGVTLNAFDFEAEIITICSLENGNIIESELFRIN